MLLIREIYESIPPNSKIILSCNHKIIFNTEQNSYCFYDDLTSQSFNNKKFLAIARDNSEYICTVHLDDSGLNEILSLNNHLEVHDLRRSFNMLDENLFKLISRAVELSIWLNESNYCGICGSSTFFNNVEKAFGCSCSKKILYPNISPCIITLITNEDMVLLGRAKFFPAGLFSTLAGFIEAGESAEDALHREVEEEVGLRVTNIQYYGSQSWPFPSQIMLGFYCQYLSGSIRVNPDELEAAQWFHISELPQVPPTTSISGKLIHSYILDRSKP
ncbi:MAG: NAD(+) diphosphatase [Gammaproteobacteria bacterium]